MSHYAQPLQVLIDLFQYTRKLLKILYALASSISICLYLCPCLCLSLPLPISPFLNHPSLPLFRLTTEILYTIHANKNAKNIAHLQKVGLLSLRARARVCHLVMLHVYLSLIYIIKINNIHY